MNTSRSVEHVLVSPNRQYKKELYVPRQEETKVIQPIMEYMETTGKPAVGPVVYFYGMKGTGKTWLLKYLSERYGYAIEREKDYPSLTILYSFNGKNGSVLAAFVAAMVDQLDRQFGSHRWRGDAKKFARLDTEDQLQAVFKALTDLISGVKRYTLLLLLDDVDEAEKNDWRTIQDYIVDYLLERRCLIVTTASRQDTDWLRFEVYRKIEAWDGKPLSLFSLEQTKRQMELLGFAVLEAELSSIWKISSGLPRLNDLLAVYAHGKKETGASIGGGIDAITRRNDFAEFIQICMDDLIPTEVQADLALIYPLRSYEREEVRYLMIDQKPELSSQPINYFLTWLKELSSKTRLVSLDKGKKAFVTHPVVRRIFNFQALSRCKAGEDCDFLKQHQRVIAMYWEWATDTPKVSDKYLVEIIFHYALEYLAHKDPERLVKNLEKVIRFAQTRLNPNRYSLLLEALEEDQEIKENLPIREYQQLVHLDTARG